jgi:hypothetical protein
VGLPLRGGASASRPREQPVASCLRAASDASATARWRRCRERVMRASIVSSPVDEHAVVTALVGAAKCWDDAAEDRSKLVAALRLAHHYREPPGGQGSSGWDERPRAS